ncbi:ATP-binding cassette domain-containing protein [Nocardia sp. NPDC004568]|uniref:ABC transporter ATP-binding protein n=1 Tax=Nocardia sp. NPDC004568 TaxID=3154551 RepID=UPI00339FF1B1
MSGGVVVDDLSIHALSGAELLAPISLRVPPGAVTALTGPSGTGKTTLMRALLGHLGPGTTRTGGTVHIAGRDVFALSPAARQAFRRRTIAFVDQDPGAALNPTMRVRTLLREAAARPSDSTLRAALARVDLPESFLRRRPGELSGGEQRRVALAVALVREVGVLVADEPLAGLHGNLRNAIADLLRSLAIDDKIALVVSGHNTGILHRLADDVVELGAPPRSAPARIAARATEQPAAGPPTLEATAICATAGRAHLLRSVDLTIPAGGSVALAGPSGAGKTTLARVLTGIHTEAGGTLVVDGRPLSVGRARRNRRDRRRVQLVPQNPLSTLNPKHTVLQTLSRPLRLNGSTARSEVAERAAGLLRSVDLEPDLLHRYPGALSGGQRQRIAIARALGAEPDILICDEITSALDDRTARSIMDLIERTRHTRGIGTLVISHDMAVVAAYCPRIVVLGDGAVVEQGRTADVLSAPHALETKALLA